MKQSWSSVLAGVAVALAVGEVLLRLASPILPPASLWPTGEMEVKSRQLDEVGQAVDVVFIGTSSTGAAVDAHLLASLTGFDFPYNAAIAVSTPTTNQSWLKEVVLRRTSPELVLIGVTPIPVQEVGDEFVRATKTAASAREGQFADMALLRQRGVLGDWDSRRIRELLVTSDLWTDRGHVVSYHNREASHLYPSWLPTDQSPDYADIEIALAEMVQVVREAGAEPVLVLEPFCCADKARVRLVVDYVEWLRARSEAWDVRFWDTFSVGWDPALYADPSHFNRRGTETYTRHLAELLEAIVAGQD